MPWTAKDAHRFTHKAKSAREKVAWAMIANAVLRESGDEGKAVRIANAKIAKK